MNVEYAKYMRYGKTVKDNRTSEEYVLLSGVDEKTNTVYGVGVGNKARLDLLSAWIGNWEKNYLNFRERWQGDVDQCRAERESYIISLPVADIEPCNRVRFITPNYDTLFEVTDFDTVKVNGEVRRVYSLDDYHFGFVGGAVFHICEFAELCQRNGLSVEPIS